MRHHAADRVVWNPAPEENFTGRVWFGPLAPTTAGGLSTLAVLFEPGAHTDWHRHPEGQVLYVTEGAGLVANEAGDRVTIGAGDVVYAPPGELHWHGAAPAAPMVHLSLTTGGATEWIGRKVSDQEYLGSGS